MKYLHNPVTSIEKILVFFPVTQSMMSSTLPILLGIKSSQLMQNQVQL